MTLREIRDSAKLTQKEMAQYLHMHLSNYAAIERSGPAGNWGKVAVAALGFIAKRGLLMRFLQGYFLMRGK